MKEFANIRCPVCEKKIYWWQKVTTGDPIQYSLVNPKVRYVQIHDKCNLEIFPGNDVRNRNVVLWNKTIDKLVEMGCGDKNG